MTADASLADLYLAAHRSFVELIGALDDDDLAIPVPACPGWTVRDVLSHVAGVPDDAFAGRTAGAGSDPWTASQVERNRELAVPAIITRWEAQAAGFASILDQMGEVRPPIDCHSHEHDVRGALGRPGNRDNGIVEFAGHRLITGLVHDRPLRVELSDGRVVDGSGTGEPIVLRGVTMFEVFRSRLGRRSPAQVRGYDWSEDPTDLLAAWFAFGPAAVDVVE
jgi:uncharacterized protein (TIGR03083 family)